MSASMPVDAVTPGGHETVRDGSTIASDGRRWRCEIPVFVPRRGKSTTATVVTSDPVPDVVGSATTGRTGPGHRACRADRGVDVVEQLAAVGREERAELRRVERGAAADPDEAVEPSRAASPASATDASFGSPDDAVVDDRLDARRRGATPGGARRAPTAHEGVADDERPRDAELRQVLARLVRRAGAEHDARRVEAERGRGPAHVRPALVLGATRRRRRRSPRRSETTSPYFASMSRSEPVWASGARSATPSRGTSTR